MHMKCIIELILIFLFLSIISTKDGMAKQKTLKEERQVWFSGKLEYEINNKFEISIAQEIRLSKNYGVITQSISDIGGYFNPNNFFKIGLFYRFRQLPDKDENRSEIYSNFTFKYELYDFDFSDRSRIHIKLRENKESINNFRNMLSVKYEQFKLIKPYVAAEIFYRFLFDEGDRFNQVRYYTGLKFEPYHDHQIDFYFMREEEFNTDKPFNSNVIGLEYSFHWD